MTNALSLTLGAIGVVLATNSQVIIAATGLAALVAALVIALIVARHERRIAALEESIKETPQ